MTAAARPVKAVGLGGSLSARSSSLQGDCLLDAPCCFKS